MSSAAVVLLYLAERRARRASGTRAPRFDAAEPAGEVPLALRPGREWTVMRKGKSPVVHITRFDKARLLKLLRGLQGGNREEIADLEHELERGTEVDSHDVGPDVVTMNSTVRVTDLDANETQVLTIVFPEDADFGRGRVSILSPIATALLGYRAGDVVEWKVRDATRRWRIDEIVYQPEASGDYHL